MQGKPWSYASPAGGIDASTTPVPIVAADPQRYHRVKSIQISHATLANATEFVIRRGGGAVLFRAILHTTASPMFSIVFEEPLVGNFNELIEVVTLTSAAGDVIISAQGDSV